MLGSLRLSVIFGTVLQCVTLLANKSKPGLLYTKQTMQEKVSKTRLETGRGNLIYKLALHLNACMGHQRHTNLTHFGLNFQKKAPKASCRGERKIPMTINCTNGHLRACSDNGLIHVMNPNLNKSD